MESYQLELLNMVFVLLFIQMTAATISAYLFRNIFNLGFIIISFVVGIVLIFACMWAAGTNNLMLIFGTTGLFGAAMGSTMGGFTLAVTHGNKRGTEAVIVTLGIVAFSMLVAALIGLFSGYNFQGWGSTLFIILLGIIILSLVGLFIRFGRVADMAIGLVVSIFFMIVMVYDFNKVVDKYNEASWGAAMDVAMNVFLDMLNIFVRLLPIIADAMDS